MEEGRAGNGWTALGLQAYAGGQACLASAFGGDRVPAFMKHVFSSPDAAQTALVRSMLESAGIACEIRNDAVSRAEVGIPFITELWVLRDEHYEEALSLIQSETLGSEATE